ncbi:MAG: chorismate synthase [Ruminococcaceae bacterium]|nr:chorismate synthase [Oscillospiraceae bacterium]
MKNQYGNNLRLCIYGGSHDSEIGMRLGGFPQGFTLDREELLRFMARRAPNGGAFSTPRKEPDLPEFLTGLTDNTTNGSEIHAIIRNTNAHSKDYSFIYDTPRPGHADYAALCKYGPTVDLRGGGHFSGRLTAPLCIAGGMALQYLAAKGVTVGAHIEAIHGIRDRRFDAVSVSPEQLNALKALPFPVLNEEAGQRMQQAIADARADQNSVGGIIECAVTGLEKGLGEHMFNGVEGRLASLLFAIPAVKGVEFGEGFGAAALLGSQNNDAYRTDGRTVTTATNHCGGILGGMTNGMPLVFRAAFKPTPSIARAQDTVSLSRMENTTLSVPGRHDPTVVVRAVPVVEAAAALAVLDLYLDQNPEL